MEEIRESDRTKHFPSDTLLSRKGSAPAVGLVCASRLISDLPPPPQLTVGQQIDFSLALCAGCLPDHMCFQFADPSQQNVLQQVILLCGSRHRRGRSSSRAIVRPVCMSVIFCGHALHPMQNW